MKVRALDASGDWTFGKGRSNYLKDKLALAQTLSTRLTLFLGDAFFAIQEGLDYFTLFGGKDQLAIELSLNTKILNTAGVTGLQKLYATADPRSRRLSVSYSVDTIYGPIADQFTFDQNPIG